MANPRGIDLKWPALSTQERCGMVPIAHALAAGGEPLGRIRELMIKASMLAPEHTLEVAVDAWHLKYLFRARSGQVEMVRLELALADGTLAFPHDAAALAAYEADVGAEEVAEDASEKDADEDEDEDDEDDEPDQGTLVTLPEDYAEIFMATRDEATVWATEIAQHGHERLLRYVVVGEPWEHLRLVVEGAKATFEPVHFVASSGDSRDVIRTEELLAKDRRDLLPEYLLSSRQPLRLPTAVFDAIFDTADALKQSRFALVESIWKAARDRIAALSSAAELELVLAEYADAPEHRDVYVIDELVRVEMRGEADRLSTKVSRLVLFAWSLRDDQLKRCGLDPLP